MLTIRFKDSMVCKYVAVDARFTKFGGIHLIYWRAIQDAKRAGCRIVDLGRSDADQYGLITFKRRWGTDESRLTYFRFSCPHKPRHAFNVPAGRQMRAARRAFGFMPIGILTLFGNILYKHVG